MKQKVLAFVLTVIVALFLVKGAEVAFEPQAKNFQNFLYIFSALIAAVIHPLFLLRKKEASRKELVEKLKRIKKKGDLEKNSI